MTALLLISSPMKGFPFSRRSSTSKSWIIPTPTGRYAIGTFIFHLTDATRKIPFAAESDSFREIMVQVWYPAMRVNHARTVSYLTDPALLSAMLKEQYLDVPTEVVEGWQKIHTHSQFDAPIIAKPRRLPVLVFSLGRGMSRSAYTSILEQLASHGYIVVAIDHPYIGLTVLPDGRVLSFASDPRGPEAVVERVEAMAQDVLFVLDAIMNRKGVGGRFANHIDAGKIGMMGHSLGGAAALELCRSSSRFKACADLDGDAWGKVVTEGVNHPFLVMLNEPGESHRPPSAVRKQRDDEWAAIISKKNVPAFVVKIEGTFHLSFTDLPFVVPEALLKKNGAEIPPQRGFEIITKVLMAFFSERLNYHQGAPLESVTKIYNEVTAKAYNR